VLPYSLNNTEGGQNLRTTDFATTKQDDLERVGLATPWYDELAWAGRAALFRVLMNNNSGLTVSVIFPLSEDDWSVSPETTSPTFPAFLQPSLIPPVYRAFTIDRKLVPALWLPWTKGTFSANPVPTSTALTFRTVTIQYWMTRERPFWNGYHLGISEATSRLADISVRRNG